LEIFGCSPATEGLEAPITDAKVKGFGDVISEGGGTYHVKAYCDGTNFTVAAR
jgi:hypothetical protein